MRLRRRAYPRKRRRRVRDFRARRAGPRAGLSEQANPHGRGISPRRRDGPERARLFGEAARGARHADRRREPARGHGPCRRRARRKVRARRLHAAREGVGPDDDQSGADPEAPLRSGARLRGHHHARAVSDGDRRQPVFPGEVARRAGSRSPSHGRASSPTATAAPPTRSRRRCSIRR